jgi:hypothetical protein
MFTYEKEGKQYVLTNTFRFHHAKAPFGPSPYWTARIDREILGENDAVNEKAVHRQKTANASDRVKLIEAYHGVYKMTKLDDKHALVVRVDPNTKGYSLETLDLP